MLADLIGRPFHETEWNCWELCRHVLASCHGITVPSFDVSSRDRDGINIAMQSESDRWQEVTGRPVPGDIVTYVFGSVASHIGIVIAPGKVMHVLSGQTTHIIPLTDPVWAGRISGVYRFRR